MGLKPGVTSLCCKSRCNHLILYFITKPRLILQLLLVLWFLSCLYICRQKRWKKAVFQFQLVISNLQSFESFRCFPQHTQILHYSCIWTLESVKNIFMFYTIFGSLLILVLSILLCWNLISLFWRCY